MKNIEVESGHPERRSAHSLMPPRSGLRSRDSAKPWSVAAREVTGTDRRTPFATADTVHAERVLDMAYAGSLKIIGMADGQPVQHARFDGREFLLDEVVLPGRLRLDAESAEGALIAQVVAGSVRYTGPDDVVELAPGQPVLASPGLPCSLDAKDARVRLTALDRPLLRRVAAECPGAPVAHIRFYAAQPATSAKTDEWNRALRFVTETVSELDAPSHPLITDACARILAASLLTCFPNSALVGPADVPSEVDTPVQLRRAMTFVDTNVDDIGVNDIAAAVHLSPRAVQYLFRRHLGLAPSQYVRNVRLGRAHQDLLSNDRSTATVSEVAARWGFGHTGRFAVLYRQTFGQSPHVTLRE